MPVKYGLTCALIVTCCWIVPPVFADGSDTDPLHNLQHLFSHDALVGEPEMVPCTLSDGRKSECFAITVKGQPADHQIGPWCPTNIADTSGAGGIWLESGNVHDVDGSFIKNLGTFYKDETWSMFDAVTGTINVTNSKESCQAAARPNVDPAYQNHCVQCLLDYMDTSTQRTYVIPAQPVKSEKATQISGLAGVGIALNGVRFDAPAPTDAILSAHTLAPFDDCGGHVNLFVGYHYHAATGCSTSVETMVGHAPVIGLAMDGFALHARINQDGAPASDLDVCNGHETEGLGYHYHAAEPGKNAILSCHMGATGCSNEGGNTECDASVMKRRGPRP